MVLKYISELNPGKLISHVTIIPEQTLDVHREHKSNTRHVNNTPQKPHKRVVNAPQKPQKTRRKLNDAPQTTRPKLSLRRKLIPLKDLILGPPRFHPAA
jgi:hypothetical protein